MRKALKKVVIILKRRHNRKCTLILGLFYTVHQWKGGWSYRFSLFPNVGVVEKTFGNLKGHLNYRWLLTHQK